MSKRIYSLYLEEELMMKLQDQEGKGNVSNRLQELIITYLGMTQQDSTLLDKQVLVEELSQLKEELTDTTAKVISKEQKLDIINKLEHDTRIKELQEEKDRIEKMEKCIICGGFVDETKKYKTVNGDFICRQCFYNMTPEKIRLYF